MNKDMIHEPHFFDNVRALVEWGAETYGNNTVYSFRPNPRAEIEKKSFIEFRNDVRALASELLSMGCAGRHCVVIGKLSYDWAALYYATLSIGGVLIPLDRDWQPEDLVTTAERAEAKFLFCDADIKEKAAVIEEKISFATPTVYLGGKEDDLSKICTPCGVCRQVLAEFCQGDLRILTGTPDQIQATTLTDLLPLAFSPNNFN